MASDKSRSHYQGLLIEDQRSSVWDAETTVSQAEPRPGVPQPQNKTALALSTSGTLSADKSIQIRTQRGGFAQPDGAGFTWKYSADADWRGLDVPASISHYEAILWSDLSAPVKWYIQPHAVTLQDQRVAVAYYKRNSAGATPYGVSVSVKSLAGGWSHVDVYASATAPTTNQAEPNPCLVVLPSGRLLLFHWIEDVVREEAQIRQWFSDDDGATWAIAQDSVLNTVVNLDAGADGYDCRRIRAVYGGGQILLLVHLRSNDGALAKRDLIRQYASSDEGNTFTQIVEFDGATSAGGYPDVVYIEGSFVGAYIETVNPAAVARSFELGTAYQSLTSINLGTIGSGIPAFGGITPLGGALLTDGDLTITASPDGVLYIAGRAVENPVFTSYTSNGQCVIFRSGDFGKSWAPMGQSSSFAGAITDGLAGCWYDANNADTCPRALAMTYAEGRIAVSHNWRANPGVSGTIDEPSLAVSYLGGSSTVTLPGYQRFQTDYRRVNFEDTWLPFDLPAVTTTKWTTGWTAAGAATEVLGQGWLEVGSGASANKTYTTTGLPAGHTSAQGIIWSASCAVVTEPGGAADNIAIRTELDDGVSKWAAVVRVQAATLFLVDGLLGTTLASISLPATGAGITILCGMSEGTVSVWARVRSNDADRAWQALGLAVPLSSAAGGGAALFQWGNIATSTAISRWHDVQLVTGPFTGLQFAAGQTNPNDLMQHPYSSTGAYVTDGMSLTATSGPTIRADEWLIETRYQYPVGNILRSAPRQTWRSTDTTSQTIALQMSTLANTSLQSDLIGVGLFNCNFPQATLEGYDATGAAWVALGTLDMTEGMGALTFIRRGDSVVPAGAGVDQPLFWAGEMEGCVWSFGSTSGHKITSHMSGKWTSATTRRVAFTLDGVTGAAPANGSTGSVTAKNGVFLVHLHGALYQGFRLVLTAPGAGVPAMADSFFEIGRALIGPVVVHGDQVSWGRVIESSGGTELQESRDRTTTSRVVAPTRRVIEYGWSDAVDMTKAQPVDADPDFVLADTDPSSEPVALMDGSPLDFDGLNYLLRGSDRQVVYLPRIDNLGATVIDPLVRRAESALCRITSPIQIESVQGEENRTEVVRVANVVLTEDV